MFPWLKPPDQHRLRYNKKIPQEGNPLAAALSGAYMVHLKPVNRGEQLP